MAKLFDALGRSQRFLYETNLVRANNVPQTRAVYIRGLEFRLLRSVNITLSINIQK